MRVLQVVLVLGKELLVDVLQPEGEIVLLVVGPSPEPVAKELHLTGTLQDHDLGSIYNICTTAFGIRSDAIFVKWFFFDIPTTY